MVTQESSQDEETRGLETHKLGNSNTEGSLEDRVQKSLRSHSQGEDRKTGIGVNKAKDKAVRKNAKQLKKSVGKGTCHFSLMSVLPLFSSNRIVAAPNKNYIYQPPLQ